MEYAKAIIMTRLKLVGVLKYSETYNNVKKWSNYPTCRYTYTDICKPGLLF